MSANLLKRINLVPPIQSCFRQKKAPDDAGASSSGETMKTSVFRDHRAQGELPIQFGADNVGPVGKCGL
jgi:hypothetical protein